MTTTSTAAFPPLPIEIVRIIIEIAARHRKTVFILAVYCPSSSIPWVELTRTVDTRLIARHGIEWIDHIGMFIRGSVWDDASRFKDWRALEGCQWPFRSQTKPCSVETRIHYSEIENRCRRETLLESR
ncbi:hypothetical protein BU17DRAFT_68160 [Hysterangium stoloniferum]|nr:hypothetical protein BU17DRAFT_68160 [Hysterangium stoloniferum]